MSNGRIKVYKGEDRVLILQLTDEETKEYYDWSDVDAISVKFKNQAETVLTKTLGSGVEKIAAASGKLAVTLSDTETAALLAATPHPFYVELNEGTDKRVVLFDNEIDVVAKPF